MAGVHLHGRCGAGDWARKLQRRYGFAQPGTTEIVAGHHPKNLASRRLIRALDFTYEKD